MDEVRRVLVRLVRGGYLRRHGEAWKLFGLRGPKAVVPPLLVKELSDRGLLQVEADKLVLSAAGRAFLKQSETLATRCIKDARGRECYVVVNMAESPLSLLHQRGWINAVQFEAGEKLRRDYTIGQLSPRMGVDYSAAAGGHSHREELAEIVVAARQRFNHALKAAGPGLADMLFDVCCYLKGLEESERVRNWPRASAKVVLRLALDRLIVHYGLGAPGHAPLRAWNKDNEKNRDAP